MRTLVLASLVTMVLAPVSARAAGTCAPDIDRFCATVEAGGGRIARCLKEHESELSPSCRDHLAEVKGKLEEIHRDCRPDADTVCGDVKPGAGRVLRCLKKNRSKLSAGCKAALAKPAK
jgi:hypothetical protein